MSTIHDFEVLAPMLFHLRPHAVQPIKATQKKTDREARCERIGACSSTRNLKSFQKILEEVIEKDSTINIVC